MGISTPLFYGVTDYYQMGINFLKAGMNFHQSTLNALNMFLEPMYPASTAFSTKERIKLISTPPPFNIFDYTSLAAFNQQLTILGTRSSLGSMFDVLHAITEQSRRACINTLTGQGEDIKDFSFRLAHLMDTVAHTYPKKIDDIKPLFGFHFDQDGYVLTAQTDRFFLYQVLPRDRGIRVREKGKPLLVRHPYVLGPNILAFLPRDGKSYVHAFADHGIPTYIMIVKDIESTPAVQRMTGEDDILDTRYFGQLLKRRHGRDVTLNGYCQGGFMAILGVLSGRLKGVVDRLITCVAPMDGTRSLSLVDFMNRMPDRFRDLGYARKKLPNGNRVVDGKVMSWVYKLKSIDKEAPVTSLCRDILGFHSVNNRKRIEISNTAAALMHWLKHERTDLPEAITQLSFLSYTVPVREDGCLPITFFGRPLNFKHLERYVKGVQICIAEADDLVDGPAALAPLDYVRPGFIDVTVFPKGHGAIATSHSDPDSEFAMNKRFTYKGLEFCGPVRYHLDVEKEEDEARSCNDPSMESQSCRPWISRDSNIPMYV